ncbi:inorganic phosphate transporter [Pseudorhodoplanes sp.]|uniref:inorganic phosphate transporter n=1 Tax=Pseudorhodoplanes sp. TaxID=1934341 RepID=UPI00391976EE
MAKSALDKDLKKVVRIEHATQDLTRSLTAPGLLILFLIGAVALASLSVASGPLAYLVVIAAVIAAYMALSIGANDVANNMGPAVGSRALTMGSAIAIAAVCEAAGALIAGGDVVRTISRDLLRPDAALPAIHFVLVMSAALLAAAAWIHLATFLGAPVSTTHSVIGGVIGAGVAAAGVKMVVWPVIGTIAASWVVSPVMGGLIAAALLGFIKWRILFQKDKVAAARRWVPVMVALMASVFAMYLATKGLSRVWKAPVSLTLVLGAAAFAAAYFASQPWMQVRGRRMENRRKDVSALFTLPLICSAALLSFAHGANDVANAVGPLAAIVSTAATGETSPDRVELPFWILLIGAVGISLGLALFGPKLIRTVGEKITKMDAIRAFCVALSAGITVLVASALGLPISSTHTAIGAIFGVGYLREFLTNKGVPNPAVRPRTLFLEPEKLNKTPEQAIANFRKRERRKLVRRQHVLGIVAAWVISVPATAMLAGLFYAVMAAFAG